MFGIASFAQHQFKDVFAARSNYHRLTSSHPSRPKMPEIKVNYFPVLPSVAFICRGSIKLENFGHTVCENMTTSSFCFPFNTLDYHSHRERDFLLSFDGGLKEGLGFLVPNISTRRKLTFSIYSTITILQ